MDPLRQLAASSSPDMGRKASKPLMEKRRRARINASLNQLKALVLDAFKKDSARYSKLEKSDILELTVKHLKSVQRQQLSVAMATDPSVATKFQSGYSECAKEVSRYLGSIDSLDEAVRTRLLRHLALCTQRVSGTTDLHQGHINTRPLYVHIPQQCSSVTSLPAGMMSHVGASSGSPLEASMPVSHAGMSLPPLSGLATLAPGHPAHSQQFCMTQFVNTPQMPPSPPASTSPVYSHRGASPYTCSPVMESASIGATRCVKSEPPVDREPQSSLVPSRSQSATGVTAPVSVKLEHTCSEPHLLRCTESDKVWRPW